MTALRKIILPFSLLFVALFTVGSGPSAEAQQPKKIPRVGVLWPFFPTVGPPLAEAFRQGLRKLGYIYDRNISIEYRYSEGNDSHLPSCAVELLHLKVDVIFAPTTAAALAAKNVTSEIPIITAAAADPVDSGSSVAWRGPAATSRG